MKKLALALSLAISPLWVSSSLAQFPSFELTRNFWTSPQFIDEFMGSYGFDGDKEPKVSQEESEIIQEIIPLVTEGREQEAINLLQANTTAQSSAAFDFTLGNLYLQSGQNARAIRAYKEALRKMPNFLNAHKNLGSVYVQQGSFEEAITHLLKTIELGGNSGVLYGVIGYSYLNLGKFASAENAYRNAILMQPDAKDWKNGLIQALNAQGKHEELIGLLTEVIQENPDNRDYWMFQANAYTAIEDFENAIGNLELLDRMNKSTAKSLMLLGDLYLQMGVPESALGAYQKALAKGGSLGNQEYIRAAGILINQGNYEEGEEFITEVFEKREGELSDKERLELYNLQSEVYLSTGEEDKAAETLENIIKEDPLNGKALLNLAEYHWRKDNIEEAETYFENAQKVEEFEVDALVQHARMLVQQRKFDLALELLRRVVILDNSDRYRQYLEAVERAAEVQGA